MKTLISMLSFIVLVLFGCKRTEGEGGRASISGKVFVIDLDNKFEDTLGQYYSGKEDVYIVYGEEEFYGDKIETHYDGSYLFDYLQPGNYKVYTYSEDTAGTNQLIPVIQEVTISEKDESVTLPDMVIIK